LQGALDPLHMGAQQKQNKQINCVSNFKTNNSFEAAVLEGLAACAHHHLHLLALTIVVSGECSNIVFQQCGKKSIDSCCDSNFASYYCFCLLLLVERRHLLLLLLASLLLASLLLALLLLALLLLALLLLLQAH